MNEEKNTAEIFLLIVEILSKLEPEEMKEFLIFLQGFNYAKGKMSAKEIMQNEP